MAEQLTPHFKRSEFACKCGCGKDTVDYQLLMGLEALHGRLTQFSEDGIRIRITSGSRCQEYNDKIGGEELSQHVKCRAADIQVDQLVDGQWEPVAPEVVADAAEYLKFGGVGRYKSFTHVDSRDGCARWVGYY